MSYYNKLLENIILPFGDLLTSSSVMKHLNTIRRYDLLGAEELRSLQEKKLNEILTFATEHSQYFKDLGIRPNKDPIAWLKKFPVLEKSTLSLNRGKMVVLSGIKLHAISTSGSTGERSTLLFTSDELSYIRANQIHWWELAGYKIGDKILQTGISNHRFTIKQLKNIIFRTKYVKAFSHTQQQLKEILHYLVRNKNVFIVGFASSLYLLAEKAKELGITSIKAKSVLSLGGKLFDFYRESVESVFNCKVFDTYGCGEGMGIACQKDLNFMYLITPNVYIEIVDNNGDEVNDGEMGHVLLTNLNARAMPIIRYRIGDLATKLPVDDYPKVRELNYPLLKNIIGRDTDIVKTKTGKYLVVHSFTAVFKYYSSIRQFCVIQRDLDGIEIQYIKGDNFSRSNLASIQEKVDLTLGEHLPITFNEVEYISPTPSGKPQIIQSFLPKTSLGV